MVHVELRGLGFGMLLIMLGSGVSITGPGIEAIVSSGQDWGSTDPRIKEND